MTVVDVIPRYLTTPCRELSYVLQDAAVSAVLASQCEVDRMTALAQPAGVPVHVSPPHS